MAEWLIEEGIGEERAIRLENGRIAAARLHWPGRLSPGQVEDAVLVSKAKGSTRGTARFANSEEALVDQLPRDASEGASLRLRVTRAAIGNAGRFKLAQARPTDEPTCPEPGLGKMLEAEGHKVRIVHRFPVEGWDEILGEALDCEVTFDGGLLLLSPTPAMTLIDVDGALPPRQLALAAVPAIAATLKRLDIGGSIGIDFPTLADKADRRAVDEALAQALAAWPHERTAMNGFGFVQIVARLEHPSILQRAAHERAEALARLLLRKAERVSEPGALMLTCHPWVATQLRWEWSAELGRRTGRKVRIDHNPSVAPDAGFAQAVPL